MDRFAGLNILRTDNQQRMPNSKFARPIQNQFPTASHADNPRGYFSRAFTNVTTPGTKEADPRSIACAQLFCVHNSVRTILEWNAARANARLYKSNIIPYPARKISSSSQIDALFLKRPVGLKLQCSSSMMTPLKSNNCP